MLKDARGAIVCLSSISGEAGEAGQAVYGPAKLVTSGITKGPATGLMPTSPWVERTGNVGWLG